jgi:hypothetical protein
MEVSMTETMLTSADVAALNRTIELALAEKDQARVEQVKWKLQHNDRRETAEFCCYRQQSRDLELRPWESGPAWLNPEQVDSIIAQGPTHNGGYTAAVVLKRMLAHGLSKYDPTPRESIDRARGRITRHIMIEITRALFPGLTDDQLQRRFRGWNGLKVLSARLLIASWPRYSIDQGCLDDLVSNCDPQDIIH